MESTNSLLANLPHEVMKRIQPDFAKVSLVSGKVIHKPGMLILDLYFPTTCMISITIRMRDGRTVETGAIGSREVAGINAFMGGRETSDTEYIVQLPGEALKIAAAKLKKEFDRNTEMRDVMLRYTQAYVAQISQNVACNRLHDTDQRFARWMLEVRDRVQAEEFPLTHGFIAEMLATRRASVSEAAMKLKKKGIIEYTRGRIKILDQASLESRSCECYSILRKEYDRLLDRKP
jgi:CRP-like cAMP-binding protein